MVPVHLAQTVAQILQMKDTESDPDVVERFGYDPTIMIRRFGLMPRDDEARKLLSRMVEWPEDWQLVDRLRLLEGLELEIADNERRLAEAGHRSAPQIVLQAVLESGEYGVAFWPVHSGPSNRPEHRLHVSDRLDIRRLDGRPTTDEEVWRVLGQGLSRARALPSSADPRWPGQQAESLLPDPHVSRWNLRRLDVPRRPRVPQIHPGLPAIVFSATVSSTWVGNLASLIAMVLGYGVTSTTDLGRRWGNDAEYKARTEHRNLVHSELLRNPGERLVWFHAAKDHADYPRAPWEPVVGKAHPSLVHIRLIEDDELLKATAEDRERHGVFEHRDLAEWSRARDRARDSMPVSDRVKVLEVGHAGWATMAKWQQTFERVMAVLSFLRDDLGIQPWGGLADAQRRWVESDHELALPTFTWLREAGAPFVLAPAGVEPVLDLSGNMQPKPTHSRSANASSNQPAFLFEGGHLGESQ